MERIGAFAETVAIDEAVVAPKPEALRMEEAESLPLVALTAWQVLVERAKLGKAQKGLIHAGSGGVEEVCELASIPAFEIPAREVEVVLRGFDRLFAADQPLLDVIPAEQPRQQAAPIADPVRVEQERIAADWSELDEVPFAAAKADPETSAAQVGQRCLGVGDEGRHLFPGYRPQLLDSRLGKSVGAQCMLPWLRRLRDGDRPAGPARRCFREIGKPGPPWPDSTARIDPGRAAHARVPARP